MSVSEAATVPLPVSDMHSASRQSYVGALLVFDKPAHAEPEHVAGLREQLIATTGVAATFRRHPGATAGEGGLHRWAEADIALDAHVLAGTVEAPGDQRSVLRLVERLHAEPLEPDLPAWRVYLIDGLAGDQFAIYVKVHHALADGVDTLNFVHRMLDRTPNAGELRTWWQHQLDDTAAPAEPAPQPAAQDDSISAAEALASWSGLMKFGMKKMSGVANKVPNSALAVGKALVERDLAVPYRAPNTIFNTDISSARTMAVRSWRTERLSLVRRNSRTTMEELLLAVCSGALRAYLAERGALPAQSLIAMVPMANHTTRKGVHKTTTVFCKLGTHEPYPEQRLEAVRNSMATNKGVANAIGPVSDIATALMTLTPKLPAVAGVSNLSRPSFNVLISYVPGARELSYYGDNRLRATYPIPVVTDGLGLGIAITSTEGSVDLTVSACPEVVPDVEAFAGFLDRELATIEKFYG